MKLVDDKPEQIVDTFAARHLHALQEEKTIYDYIDYSKETGNVYGDAQRMKAMMLKS